MHFLLINHIRTSKKKYNSELKDLLTGKNACIDQSSP